MSHGGNTVALAWDPGARDGEGEASLELRCIELPVHVYNDGFSGRSCRVSAAFELPFTQGEAAQLAAWIADIVPDPASN